MRLLLFAFLLPALSGAVAPLAASAASTAPVCVPGDPVVWVNTSSKVYHMKGDPYYGNTKHGEYLCRSAADAAGDHLSKEKSSASPGAQSRQTPPPGAKVNPALHVPLPPTPSPTPKHHKTHPSPAPS